MKKILVCGASVAGPVLAYWLAKYGYSVVVVEKAAKLRDGGQNIDIKDAGQQVIRRMGLADRIQSKNTREKGLKVVDAANRDVAVLPASAEGSLTSPFEILRGDLSQIFYEATRDAVEYRFGTFVTGWTEDAESVRVTFQDGSKETFALLISAEGIGSATRKMAIEANFKYVGAYTSYFRIPREPQDDLWARWYNAEGGKVVLMRPGKEKATTVSVSFLSQERSFENLDVAAQKAKLRQVLAGAGWQCDRIAAHLDYEQDFYFGALSQVQAASWSRGRFAIVGDAAYCPTPLTGMGTSLALVGAYILAGEIASNPDHQQAFRNYEDVFRPYVEQVQSLPPGVPWMAHPKTRWGIRVFHTVAKILASAFVQKLIAFVASKKKRKDEFYLPDYSRLVPQPGEKSPG